MGRIVKPKIEVWDYATFSRELRQRGVAMWKGSYDKSVAAAFIGVRVTENKKLDAGLVRITTNDKVVDINVLAGSL